MHEQEGMIQLFAAAKCPKVDISGHSWIIPSCSCISE